MNTNNNGMRLLYFDTWRRSPTPVSYPGCVTVQVLNACTPGGQGGIRSEAGRIKVLRDILGRRRRVLNRTLRYFQAIGGRRTLAKIRSNVLAYQSQLSDTVAGVSGAVKEVGGCSGVSLGSIVAGYRTSHPLYADFVLLHPDQVVEVPNGVQPDDAATVYDYALALETSNRLQNDLADSHQIMICGNTLVCRLLERFLTDSGKEFESIAEATRKSRSYLLDVVKKRGTVAIGDFNWFLDHKEQLTEKMTYLVGLNADILSPGEWEKVRGNWIGLPHSALHNLSVFSRMPLGLPSYLNSKGLRAALLDMKKRNWKPSDFLKPYSVNEVAEESRVPLKRAHCFRASNVNSGRNTIVRRAEPRVSGKKPCLPVGFIGLGMWARGNLIPFLLKDSRVRLVMGVDQNPIRLQQAADLFDIPIISTNSADACSSEEVDAVFISTWHDSHAMLAAEALRSGKKVFVEKPLALDYGQLDELLLAVKEARNPFLAVGFNRVHSDVTKMIRSELAKDVGPVTLTAVVREPTIPPTHYYYWPHQGPRIVSNGSHWIDYAFHLLLPRIPSDIRVIPALGIDDESNNTILMRYNDGSLATLIFASRGESLIGGNEYIDIKCNGTQFVIQDFKTCTRYQEGKLKRIWYGKADRGWQEEMKDVVNGILLEKPPRNHEEVFMSAALALEAKGSYESGGETRKVMFDCVSNRVATVYV